MAAARIPPLEVVMVVRIYQFCTGLLLMAAGILVLWDALAR